MAVDKREQVFISSTYLDLKEERQEVIQTLLEADCIPSGMELFPASDDDRWTLIRRVIDDCDYYVVVIGGRYGSVDPDRGLSYTEMEFDYAVSQKKPVMAFLHGDPGSIAGSKLELGDEAREKLNAFRTKASDRMVKYWTSAHELGGQVAKSLIQIRKTHPAEGWIRARNALTPEVETELVQLRARVAELQAEAAAVVARVYNDVESLAQGEDTYSMNCFVRFYPKPVTNEDGRIMPSTRRIWWHRYDVSWNEILGALGPDLIDEATETTMDSRLDHLARELVDVDDMPKSVDRLGDIGCASGVIDDVKIQLFTLGLIERSERRRAVSDTNTYWTLTSAGRDQVMRLRAIRRGDDELVETELTEIGDRASTS